MSEKNSKELPEVTGYRLIELLAQASNGEVYRAREQKTQEIKAIKILKDEDGAHLLTYRELKQSIEQLKKIDNNSLVLPTDVFEHDNTSALVMDYISGDTLARLIERGDLLSASRGLEVAYQLLSALAALHEHEFTHGAIKSEKIFIKDNDVFITGVGVAKRRIAGEDVSKDRDIADLAEIIEQAVVKPIPHAFGVLLSGMMRPPHTQDAHPCDDFLKELRALKKSYSASKEVVTHAPPDLQSNYSDELDVFEAIPTVKSGKRLENLLALIQKNIWPISIVGLSVLVVAVMSLGRDDGTQTSPSVSKMPSEVDAKSIKPSPVLVAPKEPKIVDEQFEQAFAELKGIMNSIRQHPEFAERHRGRLLTLAKEAAASEKMSLLVVPLEDAIKKIDDLQRRAGEQEYKEVSTKAATLEKRGALGVAILEYQKFIDSDVANAQLRERAQREIDALALVADRAFARVMAQAEAACKKHDFAGASLQLTKFAELTQMPLMSERVIEAVKNISERRRAYELALRLRIAKEETEKKIKRLNKSVADAVRQCSRFKYDFALTDLRAIAPQDFMPHELAPDELKADCLSAARDVRVILELIELESVQFYRCAARVASGERQVPVRLKKGDLPKRVIKITEQSILLRGITGEIELSWMSFSVRAQLSFFNELYGNPNVFEERLAIAIMAFMRGAYDVVDEHLDAAKKLASVYKQKLIWERVSDGLNEFIRKTPLLPQ